MDPRSAIHLAADDSVPKGSTVLLITAIGLGVILMLIMVIGRRYRRMVIGDGDTKRKRDETPDAWSESAKRIHMSDGDADAND